MNAPLRLFLMTRKNGDEWKILVSQMLADSIDEWARLSGTAELSGILHAGFGRPPARSFDEITDLYKGRLLVTQAAVHLLPESFLCSESPVEEVFGLRLFLALHGWGYSVEDPTLRTDADRGANKISSNHRARSSSPEFSSWVAEFLEIAPAYRDDLRVAEILDEESYVQHEGELDASARTALGHFRYDSLIRDPTDPLDIVKCAPPWLREREIQGLPLTVRLTNVFSINQVALVSDLDEYDTRSLTSLQNFGRKSLRHLAEALIDGLRQGVLASPPKSGSSTFGEGLSPNGTVSGYGYAKGPAANELGLMGSLLKTLNELKEREREILFGRMGFYNAPRTLEDLGSDFGVTRERIRQLERRSLDRIIAKEIWDDVMRYRLNSILEKRDDPLPLFGLEIVDDWFKGTADKEDVFGYLVNAFCEGRVHVVRIGGIRYVTRIDQETWERKLREARRLLESAVGLNWSEPECRRAVDSLLLERGGEMSPLLWQEASRLCHFSGNGEARMLTAYGRGAEQLVQVVLENSPEPLHTNEIASLVNDLAGRQIEDSSVRNATANVAFLLGRGTYGLRKHVPLSDSELEGVAELASEIVAESTNGRQWHSSELVSELEGIDASLENRLEKYTLNIALQLKSQLSYLGRLVWVAPEVDERHRIDIGDAVVRILEVAGRPMTTRAINDKLSEIRGVNSTVQIWNRDPVLRVGRGLWGLNDRDVPLKRNEQVLLIDGMVDALRQKGSGIHIDEVRQNIEQAWSMDAEAIFSIAALDERISVGVGRFAYLVEWGETRRHTILGALEILAKESTGPMKIEEIRAGVELLTERPCETSRVAHALSKLGNEFLGDGTWELRVRVLADELDEQPS